MSNFIQPSSARCDGHHEMVDSGPVVQKKPPEAHMQSPQARAQCGRTVPCAPPRNSFDQPPLSPPGPRGVCTGPSFTKGKIRTKNSADFLSLVFPEGSAGRSRPFLLRLAGDDIAPAGVMRRAPKTQHPSDPQGDEGQHKPDPKSSIMLPAPRQKPPQISPIFISDKVMLHVS